MEQGNVDPYASESANEPKKYHENAEGVGAMAFRASWLYEKMKGLKQGSGGLPVVADAPIADMLRKNYPQVEVYDAGSTLYELGPEHGVKKVEEMTDKEKQMLLFDWVIAAEPTGVYLKNLRDHRFVVMKDTDFLEENWRNGMPEHTEELREKKAADQSADEDYLRRKEKGEANLPTFGSPETDEDKNTSLASFRAEMGI